MKTVTEFLASFPTLPMDHVNALIALAALGLAAYAIYAVSCVVKEQKKR
jgi:hypothetical protein